MGTDEGKKLSVSAI